MSFFFITGQSSEILTAKPQCFKFLGVIWTCLFCSGCVLCTSLPETDGEKMQKIGHFYILLPQVLIFSGVNSLLVSRRVGYLGTFWSGENSALTSHSRLSLTLSNARPYAQDPDLTIPYHPCMVYRYMYVHLKFNLAPENLPPQKEK